MRKHDVTLDDATMTISVPFPTDMHGNPLTPRDIVAFTDGDGNDRQHTIEGFFLVLDDDTSDDWNVIGHAHWQLDLGGMGTVPADETLLVPEDTEQISSAKSTGRHERTTVRHTSQRRGTEDNKQQPTSEI